MVSYLEFIVLICFPSILLCSLQKNARTDPSSINNQRVIYSKRSDGPIQEGNKYSGLTHDPRSSYRSNKILPYISKRDYGSDFEYFDPFQAIRSYPLAYNIGRYPQLSSAHYQKDIKPQIISKPHEDILTQKLLKFIQTQRPLEQILQEKFGNKQYNGSLSFIDLSQMPSDISTTKSTSTSTTNQPVKSIANKPKPTEGVKANTKKPSEPKAANVKTKQPSNPNEKKLETQSNTNTSAPLKESSANGDKKNAAMPIHLEHRPMHKPVSFNVDIKNTLGIDSNSSGINLSNVFTYKIMDNKNIDWDSKFFQFTLSFFNMHDIPIHTREHSIGEKSILNEIRQDRNISAYKMDVLLKEYNRDKMIRFSSDVCAYRGHDCLSCLVDFQCAYCPSDKTCYDYKLAFNYLKDKELCSGVDPYYYMSCNLSSVAIFSWLIVLIILLVILLVLICVMSCYIAYYKRDLRKFYNVSKSKDQTKKTKSY